MRRLRWLAAVASVGAITAGVALSPASARTHSAQACTPANNIAWIVDDSGSMAGTDPQPDASTPPLRVQAMQQEIKDAANAQKTFAAVEFGSDAGVLFGPLTVGPNQATMLGSLSKIQADNGSTDYNAAFDLANSTDPSAQGRIFLTDGGHNAGTYNNGHLGGGKPRTMVIGFISGASPDDIARLQMIANDTGGHFFNQTSSSDIVSNINDAFALLNCQSILPKIVDVFRNVGEVQTDTVKVPRGRSVVTLLGSWLNGGLFQYFRFQEVLHGKVIAKGGSAGIASTRVKRLRITKTTGAAFATIRIRGLKPGGKLKFKIKARKIPALNPFNPTVPPGQVTTQIKATTR
jgi:hypothetical protein